MRGLLRHAIQTRMGMDIIEELDGDNRWSVYLAIDGVEVD